MNEQASSKLGSELPQQDEENEARRSSFSRSQSLNKIYAAQYVVTATVLPADAWTADPPVLGSVVEIPAHAQLPHNVFTRVQSSGFASSAPSTGTLSVPEITCLFRNGAGPVWVSPAQAKGVSRMKQKVAEYAAEGAVWPCAGCILDPVRASVVCKGAAQILEVAEWFIESRDGTMQLPVCRVKNKFAMSREELVSVI
jgi:hypothetical protein